MRKELTFNQWQEHLTKELDLAYKKLKLRKDENISPVSFRESDDLCRIRKNCDAINK